MAKESSVAPQERVNIRFTPATGGAQEGVELPFKMLMIGNYTGRPDGRPLEDRKTVSIDKDCFEEVLRSQDLQLSLTVPSKVSGKEGEDMAVELKFQSMKDFSPESLVHQIPELSKLLQLRTALQALKGPLGNIPAFRRKIEALIGDVNARERLLKELGAEHSS